MVTRIKAVFDELATKKRKALIPFVMAGDPDLATSDKILKELVEGGANLIEIGVPFSDPMADGPVIQSAAERALKNNVTLVDVLNLVERFRQHDSRTPIVLMGYTNPIEAMGYKPFAVMAKQSGVDGVLVVDTPPEECAPLQKILARHTIDLIFLLSPTSTEARCRQVAKLASGYVYYVSLTGVTGASHIDWEDLSRRLPAIRKTLAMPLGIGFGIQNEGNAIAASKLADAVIIGSKLITTIHEGLLDEAPLRARNFIRSIRTALDTTA